MAGLGFCLKALLLCSMLQPPGSPPGSSATPATQGVQAGATGGAPVEDTPLGLHVLGLVFFAAITAVLVYPTRRQQG